MKKRAPLFLILGLLLLPGTSLSQTSAPPQSGAPQGSAPGNDSWSDWLNEKDREIQEAIDEVWNDPHRIIKRGEQAWDWFEKTRDKFWEGHWLDPLLPPCPCPVHSPQNHHATGDFHTVGGPIDAGTIPVSNPDQGIQGSSATLGGAINAGSHTLNPPGSSPASHTQIIIQVGTHLFSPPDGTYWDVVRVEIDGNGNVTRIDTGEELKAAWEALRKWIRAEAEPAAKSGASSEADGAPSPQNQQSSRLEFDGVLGRWSNARSFEGLGNSFKQDASAGSSHAAAGADC